MRAALDPPPVTVAFHLPLLHATCPHPPLASRNTCPQATGLGQKPEGDRPRQNK